MKVTPEWLAAYEAKQAARQAAKGILTPVKTSRAINQEIDLHNQIEEACRSQGWLYFHGRLDKASGRTVGEPDFTILVGGGQVLFVEAKAKLGKLSQAQVEVIAWAAKFGVTIHVVRCIEEFWQAVDSCRNRQAAS